MADTKISDLTAGGALVGTEEFPGSDGTATTKAWTPDQWITYFQTKGMPRVSRLGSVHSVSSTTGTEITGLSRTLEAGTYTYQYNLICRQATATGDAPQFAINFTGTAAIKTIGMRWWDATTAITAETHIMDNVGVKTFGYVSGMVHNAYATTACNLGTSVGVAAVGADIPCVIEGTLIVTASGDLELWHAAEGANASTVEVGSSLVVIRTA